MSFLRGYLRLSLTRSGHSKFIAFTIVASLLVCATLISLSGWSSLAAKRSSLANAENSGDKTNTVAFTERRGSTALPPTIQQQPDQTCTVSCNATVPGSGAVNTAISFSASATTTGCSTSPTYEWNFGDGSARSTQQNTTHTYTAAGTYNWSLTTSVNNGSTMIDTIAGGLGEGNLATQAPFGILVSAARDPQNRGLYVVDVIGGNSLIRFINTSTSPVIIAGKTIAPGTVRVVAGGGTELGVGIPGTNADLGAVTGLDTSADGNLLFFSAQIDREVRVLNVSSGAVTVAGTSVAPGNIGLLAAGFGEALGGIVVNNSTGEVFAADATPGINKIFRISTTGALTAVAGNGATTKPEDAFSGGQALNVPLLQPRAVELDSSNRLVIADTGHGRVVRVEANGTLTLINQFPVAEGTPNPYPVGLCVQGSNLFVTLGNQQTVVRLSGGSPVTVAGQTGQSCDYSVSNCGDGGTATNAQFGFAGSTGNPPLSGITCDSTGVFILDQGLTGRGRIRFLNTSGSAATVAGVTIAPNAVDRIGGNGLATPYDGGLATSATFNSPVGVAVDANGNLWVADQIGGLIRFVNRGTSSVKIFAGTVSEQTVAPGGIVTVNKSVGSGASDGVPVIQAGFTYPQGLFITSQGIYVVDSLGGPKVPMQPSGRGTSTLRFINTTANNVTIYPGSSSPISVPAGQIAKIAGGGESTAVNGDGGFALFGKFIGMSDVVVDSNNNIFVTDTGQNAVRRINGSTGVVSSILGGGKQYTGLGIGADNRLYVANYTDGSVLRENSTGSATFSVLAGGFNKARDVAVGADGTAYVTVGPATSVTANNQIVQISAGGTPTVIAGTTAGFSGDGGPAANAQISIQPSPLVVGSGTTNQLPETVNIIVSSTGEIIFADSVNNRIRRISSGTVACTKTGTITITGDNPVPTLTSLSPNNALVGGGSLNLTVTGTNFVPTSVVRWGGANRTTTFVSNTQLTASIPASDLTTAGNVNVTVFNPAPVGGTSNALTFTVNPPNPVPAITSLSPNSAVEGSAGFTLTVNGSGFVNGSIVRWDGQQRVTEYVNATTLRAQILASDLVGQGQASITVLNNPPGGGTSNVASFNITAGQNPVPTLTGISPATANAGGPAFTLTATGTNFVASSKVRWSGQDLATVFISPTVLTATVPANLIATGGTAPVTVFTPTPGGGVTSPQAFTITGGVPAVASVSAASFLGAELAPESIAAAFSSASLATGIAIASTVPLPTNLLGTRVTVRDSAGTTRDAGLFFVAPGQINYQIPPGTAAGAAQVTVLVNSNTVAAGAVTIAGVVPGLFSANASGTGPAAADVFRRNAAGVDTIVPASGPIDLGPSSDIVLLIAYGSGLRGFTGLSNTKATIGGVNAPVFFVGPTPGFVGLDQVNMLIDRSLIGRGTVDVILTIDGKVANTVQITIK